MIQWKHPIYSHFTLSPVMTALIIWFWIVTPCFSNQDMQEAEHVLNRLCYGPSPEDLERIASQGVGSFIENQLHPMAIEESDARLNARTAELFTESIPVQDQSIIRRGTFWRYFKGTQEPPLDWRQVSFDDGSWNGGATGIGYGDDDDLTVLDDMRRVEGQTGYLSVYLRRTFNLSQDALDAIDDLILQIDYDDGFKAYLNGTEVARANLPAGIVRYNATATGSHEAGTPVVYDISQVKNQLKVGTNVLAIQVHNRNITSSDLSMTPELISRTQLAGPAIQVIDGIQALQQLVHVRGVYSKRQLQAILAEFWENHFTTDYDKLVEYFDELQNSDATDAMSEDQARAEAAQLEYQEYQFFYENALGYFGDLLLFSATSPTMLIYLDNVLNIKGAANENYAREILELSAFGVDNRYTQKDIEELADCFTGWTVCKYPREKIKSFPESAIAPPASCGVLFQDNEIIKIGDNWRYLKGTMEPTPDGQQNPTTAWTETNYDDRLWLQGSTGIGYGDGDDATRLNDMRNRYSSVYLRHVFQVENPEALNNLLLEVHYDDGYVAYLNGQEVARSESMEDSGSPPAFDQTSDDQHEATDPPDIVNLMPYLHNVQAGQNILAIQVHNTSLNSSDLSILPRLVDRTILPGSIENGDRNGVWAFHFNADQHDTGMKTLYKGTEFKTVIPADRQGMEGLRDALEPVQAMAAHPSTAEYICIKLIQRFVADDLTLATYKDGSAPPALLTLLDKAMDAWFSTETPGHIQTVMRAILSPENPNGLFWSETAYRNKVKTPIEYINSSLRALDADISDRNLPNLNDRMGMALFTRDAPDGYSEVGLDWIDTATMLERIDFVRRLAENQDQDYGWDVASFINTHQIQTGDDLIRVCDYLFFQNTLAEADKILLLEFLNTDDQGQLKPLDAQNAADFQRRTQACIGLMLSLPQWHFQ